MTPADAPDAAAAVAPEGAARLADLTTMRVGGPADRLLVARTRDELIAHATELWRTDEPWLLLGGGSNTVVSDEGFPGTVLLVRTTGIEAIDDPALLPGTVRLRVQAGHDWDALVEECVERGLIGLEALSGIPGLVGAAPVQNIGAYGAELSDVLHSIEFLDAVSGEPVTMSAAELELGYRDSVIKQGLEGVVLSVDLVLVDGGLIGRGARSARSAPAAQAAQGAQGRRRGRHGADDAGSMGDAGAGADRAGADAGALSAPIAYAQLAKALNVELGARVPVAEVRREVLRLRASKGMVLDAEDHDTWSSGSFFTNPIVSSGFARTLPEDAPRFPIDDVEPAAAVTTLEELAEGQPLRVPEAARETRVKLSAAWLIERAGVPRGFRLPGSGAAISSKHTLALTNRGGATAAQVAELGRFVVQRVQQEFGVVLVPEPNLYGLEL